MNDPQQAQPEREAEELPPLLFDGYYVYEEGLTEDAKKRTSPENVSDVLDAVVRLMRATRPASHPSPVLVEAARKGMEALPRELMESCLAASQEATFEGFDDSVLKEVFEGPHRRLFETVYRMGFESGWRIREQQSIAALRSALDEGAALPAGVALGEGGKP